MMNPMDCRLLFRYKTREPGNADAFAATADRLAAPSVRGEKLMAGSIVGEASLAWGSELGRPAKDAASPKPEIKNPKGNP